jgi:hypothetical protein
MTTQLIRELIRYLPVNGPYPGMVLPGHGSADRSFQELCFAVCLDDCQFGYNFVMSYVRTGQVIPAGVFDLNLRRAFYYFARNCPDDLMTEAYALMHPANIGKRKILNAFLICRDINMKQVAEAMSLSETVVSVYEQLWFNVRDRMDDKYYIGSLVFPQMRFESAAEDAGEGRDHAQELLRAGYEYGAEEVLYMAGLIPTRTSTSATSKSTEELEHLQVAEAITQARHGGANAKSAPAIDRANRLVTASKRASEPDRSGDDLKGLGGVSASRSILTYVHNIQQPDIDRRIAQQQTSSA